MRPYLPITVPTWTKLIVAVLLVLVLGIVISVVMATRADAAVDYRLQVHAHPDPDGGCRVVEVDPNIARGNFPECPGGVKIANMNEGDRVYLEGPPLPDDVYTVQRVVFTPLGERPNIGDQIDYALFTSYDGARYWVLLIR